MVTAMAAWLRPASLLAGLALAAAATAATARDYVVVSSTDPALAQGQSFAAGERVALPAGRTATLMHASGDLMRIQGAPGGVLLPRRAASQGEADRLAILKVLVAPAVRSNVGGARVLAAKTRSGVCPAAHSVTTLDAIVQVFQSGCDTVAAEALEAWFASHPPPAE